MGRKCFRPNEDLPEPEGPTRRTSDNSGMLIFMDRFAFYGVLASVASRTLIRISFSAPWAV